MCHGLFRQSFLMWMAFAGFVIQGFSGEVRPDATANQPYRVTRWTTDQGLPQNRISCVKQTRDGYLWFGTWFGLARYDGARFTVFDKFNTPELMDDAINALVEDSDGTLWIATADGLISYRDHRFHRLTTEDGLPNRRVWRLASCRSAGIWLQAGDFVAHLESGKFSRVCEMRFSDDNAVRALRVDAEGWLHIVLAHIWLKMAPDVDECRTNYVLESASYQWLTGLPTSSQEGAWAATTLGLRRWENGKWETVGAEQLGQRSVDFLFQDHFSNLWVNARPDGLYCLHHTNWTAIDLGDRIRAESVLCMEEDREGNFWLGTEQGLVQLQKRRLHSYAARDGLADDHVWSVCEGADGTIWAAGNRGLNAIQNGRVLPPNAGDSDLDHPDRCVWPARDGGVLIAKSGIGVLQFNGKFKARLKANNLPDPNISALYEDRSNRLWIGTGNGVATMKDGQVTASYTNWAGKSEYDVRCILEDRTGDFWFGTQGRGLTRMHDGRFDVFTEHNGLSNNRVWSIHEDADGALWLGTEKGLTRYFQGRFFSFALKEGLLENAINWILEDDFGFLWLSGLRGIYRVERRQLNAVAEGRASTVQVAAFGTDDGMESSETNGEGQPAGWKSRDGRLWFPTTRGVVVIDPKTIEVSKAPPPVVIEQVKADEEIIFGDGVAAGVGIRATAETRDIHRVTPAATRLGPGRAQAVEISYTANTFVDPKRAGFRYRLVGRDSGWRKVTNERVAHYTNLRPGAYRFEVVAANHQGVWSDAPASFAFTLAPHFYETWPFYFLCTAGLIGVVVGVQAYRLRWQRRLLKLDEQRALANERARIARDLHDDLGTALTGLALELDVAGRDAERGGPLAEQLSKSARHTRDLAERMREVVWTVNPRCDTVSSLADFLEQQVEQFLRADGLRVHLDFPEHIPEVPLGAEARHQLALSVREALTNVIRHARASEVTLSLAMPGQSLVVQVKDNGQGFQPGECSGHGLANMRARIEQIGGAFDCSSAPGTGTVITFRLPLKNSAPASGTSP